MRQFLLGNSSPAMMKIFTPYASSPLVDTPPELQWRFPESWGIPVVMVIDLDDSGLPP